MNKSNQLRVVELLKTCESLSDIKVDNIYHRYDNSYGIICNVSGAKLSANVVICDGTVEFEAIHKLEESDTSYVLVKHMIRTLIKRNSKVKSLTAELVRLL